MKFKFYNSEEAFDYLPVNINNKMATVTFKICNITDVNHIISLLQSKEHMNVITFYTDDDMTTITEKYTNYELSGFKFNFRSNSAYVSITNSDIYSELDYIKSTLNECSEDVEELNKQINPEPVDTSKLALEEAKEYQLNLVNEQCQKAIYNGVDLETSVGNEHFSLTQEDQTNITTLYNQVVSGIVVSVPYHADGELCRQFSAEEMINLGNTALAFVTYCTTKCNHLRAWIKRENDKDNVLSITFDSELPKDLLENMNSILNVSNEVTDNETKL